MELLAALFILRIVLQLLVKAKKNLMVVVYMTKIFIIESFNVIVGHFTSISGSALVTAAMAP